MQENNKLESVDSRSGRSSPSGLEGEDLRLETVTSEALKRPADRVLALLVELEVGVGHTDARLEVLVPVLVNIDLGK